MSKMGDSNDGEERLVLSEVHVGSGSLDYEAELVSRYTYLTPSSRADNNSSSGDSSSDSSSDSEGEERNRSNLVVARRRKRARIAATASTEISSTATSRQQRQRFSKPSHEVLTVVHKMATPIDLVGQQVWSAAFLLGDYVLSNEHLFTGMKVLELGAGPGVAGLIAARVARKCYLTDYHHEVLALLARNAEANLHLFACEGSAADDKAASSTAIAVREALRGNGNGSWTDPEAAHDTSSFDSHEGGEKTGQVVMVRELDWLTFSRRGGASDSSSICSSIGEKNQVVPNNRGGEDVGTAMIKKNGERDNGGPHAWWQGELENLVSPSAMHGDGLVILAADVIYDENLTEALFDALRFFMPVPPLPSGCSCRNRSIPLDPTETVIDHTLPKSKNSGGGNSLVTANLRLEKISESSRPHVSPAENIGANSARRLGGLEAPQEKGASINSGKCCCSDVGGESQAIFYLALEKRFNFSVVEMSVAATGYNALLRNVLDVTNNNGTRDKKPCTGEEGKEFEGTRLPLNFEQCFQYRRSEAMEVWKIRRRLRVVPSSDR